MNVSMLVHTVQEGVNDLVEQLRVAVVVPPPLEAAFRLVPRSAFLVSHAVSPQALQLLLFSCYLLMPSRCG